MSKVNSEFARQYKSIVEAGWKLKAKVWTPADNDPISADDPPLLIASPAGAIDLLMPASNAANQGLMFLIVNNSANAITLKTSADAAFTTAIALAANETTLVVCTGHATAALGWQAIGTASSA
jgi:hypothetical protein